MFLVQMDIEDWRSGEREQVAIVHGISGFRVAGICADWGILPVWADAVRRARIAAEDEGARDGLVYVLGEAAYEMDMDDLDAPPMLEDVWAADERAAANR